MQELKYKSFLLEDVQKRRFRRMKETLQILLGYASYQGMRFFKELVLQLAEQLDRQGPETPQQTFEDAINPYATIVDSSAQIYEFRHRVFYGLANTRIDRLPELEKKIAKTLAQIGKQWYQDGKHQEWAVEERESYYLLMLKVLDDEAHGNGFRRDILIELLALHYKEARYTKALPLLDELDAYFSGPANIQASAVPFGSHIGVIRLLMELNCLPLAESIAKQLLAPYLRPKVTTAEAPPSDN